jgi:hypothetical protein
MTDTNNYQMEISKVSMYTTCASDPTLPYAHVDDRPCVEAAQRRYCAMDPYPLNNLIDGVDRYSVWSVRLYGVSDDSIHVRSFCLCTYPNGFTIFLSTP